MPSDGEQGPDVNLSHVRIVDFSRVLAGPFATQVLAALGADVVKVEFPNGDAARAIGPHLGDRSLYFSAVNTGKRGLVVDPRSHEGKATINALVDWGDVVVHNFRPDAADALGLTPTALLARNDQLVVVTISGYSSDSEQVARPAYDLTIQAESGLMAVTGEANGPPLRCGAPVSDLVGGLWAAIGVTSGLLTRQQMGHGLHIEVPLLDASLPLLSYMATAALATGEDPVPVGSGHHRLVPYRGYATKDGHIVIAVLADKFWGPLCRALGLDRLASRDDLRTVEGRCTARAEIDSAVERACAQRTTTEVQASLSASGVPCAVVNGVLEALTGDYAEARHTVQAVETPEGTYHVVRGPFDPAAEAPRPAPRLGEHTDEVLDMLRTLATERGGGDAEDT